MNINEAAHTLAMIGHAAKCMIAATRVVDLEGYVANRGKYIDMVTANLADLRQLLGKADDALLLLRKLVEDE